MALLLGVSVSVFVGDSESHSNSNSRNIYIYISIFYVAFHGDWNKMSKGIHGFCQNIAQIEKEPVHRLKTI